MGGGGVLPAYQEKRSSLLDYLENEYRIKMSRMSPNRIFMFLINPPSGNVRVQKLIAKYIRMLRKKERGRRQSEYPRAFKSLSIYLINLI